MTVFWSDPTDIRLTLPPGDELEEEHYFAEPKNLARASTPEDLGAKLRDVLEIKGPGVAEIKAHNRQGIVKAIEQLLTYTLPRSSSGRVMEARNRLLSKIIITYRPAGWSLSNRNPSPLTVDVYATRFEPDKSAAGMTRRLKNGTTVPLTGKDVGYYHTDMRGTTAPAKWVLVKKGVPVPPSITVSLDNGSVLGAAVEARVRNAFTDALRKAGRHPYGLHKPSDDTGADVMWTEIAEMYAELARTTNDEFLAELANELAVAG